MPARPSLSRKSTTAFGSSPSCTMILDTSTWSREPCNPSTTPSAQGCHPCLRYALSPMSPGRTKEMLERAKGFEPSTPTLARSICRYATLSGCPPVPDIRDRSSQRTFALRPIAAPSDRPSPPVRSAGTGLPHGFVLACWFRNAASPVSDTSTHFLSGDASAT
jgi:hypothetical protein